jgi:xanthine/CO dehydrogenase XdhC/CoxF family maturation factor
MPLPRLDTSLEALLERLSALHEPAVLATIVATAGSTYRKAGARMLIEADGRLTGLLSGGCLEHDLREYARGVLATGQARVVEYDLRNADDLLYGIGAGCEGAMRILLEPVDPAGALAADLHAAARQLASGTPVALAIAHRGPDAQFGTRVWNSAEAATPGLGEACSRALLVGRSEAFRGSGGTETWIQVLAAPPHMLVCGAGPDAEPLVALLRSLRFPVTVSDHRPAYADPGRFPGATVSLGSADSLAARVPLAGCFAAVVMSHHLGSDESYLRLLAASPVAHIGLLGPRPRRERLLAALGPEAERLRLRLRGPVGFDIGAATPEGIALAIAAELHALAAGRACSSTGMQG